MLFLFFILQLYINNLKEVAMKEIIENTYLAYNQFMEGEINEYDLMSLIENEVISEALLESILNENNEELEESAGDFVDGTIAAIGAISKHIGPAITGTIAAGGGPALAAAAGAAGLGAYGTYKLIKYLKNRKKKNQNRPYKAH